ncbi:MAG: hypothetical protein Q9211_001478 [Gyalolechia sp. 1 TL-2023]
MLCAVSSLVLSATALYAARQCYIAIVNLRKYEERSKKAAKHSDTAAHELYKTRVTQASSAAAVIFSLVSSLAVFLRILVGSSTPPKSDLVLPPINAIALIAAFLHNQNFWKAKAKVPFVGGFNEGIEKSKDIRRLIIPLGVGWAIIGAVQWIGKW